MNPAIPLASHPPRHLPNSDADEQTLSIATWLEKEGYHPAAQVLLTMVRKHQIITLEEVKANRALLTVLLEGSEGCDCMVRIYSEEHRRYWRDEGAGYTSSAVHAGIFSFADAWARTSHCGPEKGIIYEVLDEDAEQEAPPRVSGWKS